MPEHTGSPARPWPRTAEDYQRVVARAQAALSADADRQARATALIDALWAAFGSATGPDDRGYSWVGVYYGPGQPVPAGLASAGSAIVPQGQMLLGPRRNKPACSPIGLEGMCGRCWRQLARVVIDDVAGLGSHYIACDPADQSELVVPLLDAGVCWGVLDVDSYAIGAFTEAEAGWLEDACIALGLSDQRASTTEHPC